jgi:hypothetical protein
MAVGVERVFSDANELITGRRNALDMEEECRCWELLMGRRNRPKRRWNRFLLGEQIPGPRQLKRCSDQPLNKSR